MPTTGNSSIEELPYNVMTPYFTSFPSCLIGHLGTRIDYSFMLLEGSLRDEFVTDNLTFGNPDHCNGDNRPEAKHVYWHFSTGRLRLLNYSDANLIFLGDPLKMSPMVTNKSNFHKQLKVSLFQRALNMGVLRSVLTEQWRLTPHIAELINTIHPDYAGFTIRRNRGGKVLKDPTAPGASVMKYCTDFYVPYSHEHLNPAVPYGGVFTKADDYNEYPLFRYKGKIDYRTIPTSGVRIDNLNYARVVEGYTAKELFNKFSSEFDSNIY